MNTFLYLSKKERNGMLQFLAILFSIAFSFQSFKKEEKIQVKPEIKVRLNASSRTELQEVKGIGPVISDRIVKYKLRLGGYYSIEQIKEVYGIDTSNFDLLSSQLEIDSIWHQFDINEVEFKVLLAHPYFDYPLVKSIFRYKDRKKEVKSLQELKDLDLVNDELYGKIAPYLKINLNGK